MRRVNTHELQDGDVLYTHGMRVLLHGDGTVSESHGSCPAEWAPVLWWEAEILSVEEEDSPVPSAWIADGTWTIQGNGGALWCVEEDGDEDED
jgi:hypothetical protein